MKSQYDVVVVGAGPAGSIAARSAAEKGCSVLMLEKDRDIGYPVRCGEAINKKGLEEFITPDERWISAKISKFSLTSPDNTEVIIEFGDAGYILERRIFDYELAKTAAKAGAEIITRAYVNGLIIENNKVSGVQYELRGEQKQVYAKIVIAADGVESRVGRWAGLKTYTNFHNMECCVQVTASNINIKPDTLRFYFGENVAPGGYFWIFPKQNNSANIGLGVSGMTGKKRSALSYLNDFMEKALSRCTCSYFNSRRSTKLPTLEKITAPGIMLAGDAARQVNPLSGGGIASGMIGGSLAGRIAAESILTNKPDHIYSYEKEWHERLVKDMKFITALKKAYIILMMRSLIR